MVLLCAPSPSLTSLQDGLRSAAVLQYGGRCPGNHLFSYKVDLRSMPVLITGLKRDGTKPQSGGFKGEDKRIPQPLACQSS